MGEGDSLKQGGNVYLGLSCFGKQAGSGIWGMAGLGREGNSCLLQELMGGTVKYDPGAAEPSDLLVSPVWCWCLKAVWPSLTGVAPAEGAAVPSLG